MDIRPSLSAQQYAATRQATAPKPEPGGSGGLTTLANNFAETMQETENIAKAAMSGNADAHSLVQALAQTELAVETAVTVRDKVVEAYQEILRMPV